jgi:hypothetical protein
MPQPQVLPPILPVIRNKVIEGDTVLKFETKMDSFLQGLDSYSIQYKPLRPGNRTFYTALITYHEPMEKE